LANKKCFFLILKLFKDFPCEPKNAICQYIFLISEQLEQNITININKDGKAISYANGSTYPTDKLVGCAEG
jgi:hypothetical protein